MNKYMNACFLLITVATLCFAAVVSASDYDRAKRFGNVQPGTAAYAKKLALVTSAAERGDIKAQIALGRLYSKRQKGIRDYAAAFSWFKKAADLGSTEAMEKLAEMYLSDEGFPFDPAQAAFWIKKASDAGSLDHTYNLAFYYWDGFGVAEDRVEASRLLKYAAIKGHKSAFDFFVEQAQANDADAIEFLSYFLLDKSKSTFKDMK